MLDTKVALDKVQAQLAARGVPFAGTLEIPGREIVLADTPNLQTAATAISIFLPMANWMWVIVVIMFLVGILLWRPRARGVLWAGLGLTLGGILMYAGLNLGMDQLVSAAPSDYSFVLESVSTTLLRFLVNALLVMACLGIAMMLAAWLAGATRSGRRVRRAVADSAHRWAEPPGRRSGRTVHRGQPGARAGPSGARRGGGRRLPDPRRPAQPGGGALDGGAHRDRPAGRGDRRGCRPRLRGVPRCAGRAGAVRSRRRLLRRTSRAPDASSPEI